MKEKIDPVVFTEKLRKSGVGIVEPGADEETIEILEKMLEEKKKELGLDS